uniref:Uncharacterized protein n=1 Tax=Crocodylus porosus TaxID=8502 RepID=A0A7M4E7I8_CROPO
PAEKKPCWCRTSRDQLIWGEHLLLLCTSWEGMGDVCPLDLHGGRQAATAACGLGCSGLFLVGDWVGLCSGQLLVFLGRNLLPAQSSAPCQPGSENMIPNRERARSGHARGTGGWGLSLCWGCQITLRVC